LNSSNANVSPSANNNKVARPATLVGKKKRAFILISRRKKSRKKKTPSGQKSEQRPNNIFKKRVFDNRKNGFLVV
jgi:hypothetical protein